MPKPKKIPIIASELWPSNSKHFNINFTALCKHATLDFTCPRAREWVQVYTCLNKEQRELLLQEKVTLHWLHSTLGSQLIPLQLQKYICVALDCAEQVESRERLFINAWWRRNLLNAQYKCTFFFRVTSSYLFSSTLLWFRLLFLVHCSFFCRNFWFVFWSRTFDTWTEGERERERDDHKIS